MTFLPFRARKGGAQYRILSMKTGHDGAIAVVADGKLLCSIEPEHNAYARYAPITPAAIIQACAYLDGVPDVVAVGGWIKNGTAFSGRPSESGYFGSDESHIIESKISFMNKSTAY